MSARRGKRLSALIIVIGAIIACCLVALRVSQVNSVVPEHRVLSYALHEPVGYEAGLQGGAEADEVTLTALGCALLDQDEMGKLLFGYKDAMIAAGTASDVKFLVVRIRLTNGGGATATPNLTSLAAQEGAWHNGLDPDPAIFRAMNPDIETLELQSGQSKEALILFEAYNTQFGLKTAAWDAFGRRGLELVLAAYPDKVCIILEQPGTLRELESAAGKGADE